MTQTKLAPIDETKDEGGLAKALEAADRVALQLRSDAAERDRANQPPIEELELVREAGLLQIQEPVEFGGSGLNYAEACQVTRRLARGDTSIAHLIGYHYAQTRLPHLFGTEQQATEQSRRNAEERIFWGGIQNERGGTGLELKPDGDGYRLDGSRTFASGASVGDFLAVTADIDGKLAFLSLPGDREGLTALRNWDNMGQRLTDSGGVVLEGVRVEADELLGVPLGPDDYTPWQTLVTPHWQVAFVNFYIGTAEGALEEALEWTRLNARPWESSGVDQATDDAYILELVGYLAAEVKAAALIADHANLALQQAIDAGDGLTADERGEAAVAVYEAKLVTTRVALDVTSKLFEIQGARATTTGYGFDRHWRNIRTHTVHDPVAYKAREVGDWALNRRAPDFSLYR